MPKIKILHTPSEKEPFLIILKPKHLPSAPLRPDDESAFSQAAELFPNLIKVKGRKEIEKQFFHILYFILYVQAHHMG